MRQSLSLWTLTFSFIALGKTQHMNSTKATAAVEVGPVGRG